MKYDKVVAMNRQQGKQNAEIVKNEIQKMLERKERVTVAALVSYNPKKAIFDMVLEEKVANLKIAITKLKKQNKELLGTNERLENELKRVKAENEELKQIISGR